VSHLARDAVHLPFNGLKKNSAKLHLEVTYHKVGEDEVKAAERCTHSQADTQQVLTPPHTPLPTSLSWVGVLLSPRSLPDLILRF
jgi:hypothetical protein